MPELPEVETIRRQLRPVLVGRQVTKIAIHTPKIFHGEARSILKSTITQVSRRAKVLLIVFKNGYKMLVHLKMSGQLIIKNQKLKVKIKNFEITGSKIRYGLGTAKDVAADTRDLPNKHTQVIFTMDNGLQLFYNDIRKFGWIKVVAPTEKIAFLESLGPEPLENEFTLAYLTKIIKSCKRAIKLLIMDQTKIAGVGNIYANEALFMASIHPSKKGVDLKPVEIKKLHGSLQKSLTKGIRFGGSSQTNYVDSRGEKGKMQEHFLVYGREGERCFTCKSFIRKIVVGGRGTFYCQKCQRKPLR